VVVMKGLVTLFLAIVVFGIAWKYMDRASKKSIKQVIAQNIGVIALATVAVAIAVFFSVNTTLRLV
jgi:heme/copper-type cytochrome/quinol oxidase subunit 2